MTVGQVQEEGLLTTTGAVARLGAATGLLPGLLLKPILEHLVEVVDVHPPHIAVEHLLALAVGLGQLANDELAAQMGLARQVSEQVAHVGETRIFWADDALERHSSAIGSKAGAWRDWHWGVHVDVWLLTMLSR